MKARCSRGAGCRPASPCLAVRLACRRHPVAFVRRPRPCRAALLNGVDAAPALTGACSSGGRLNVAKAVASLLGGPAPTYTRE